jgi:MFS family permease
MIGMNACLPFLPLYVRVLGVTDAADAQRWTGFVYAGAFLLSIFTVPMWGALGDKYGKKLMIVRAIFGLTLAMFLMGFVQNVWQLFLLRIFQGGVSGFIAASLSLVSSSTPAHKRGYAMSFMQTSISAGTVVGPLIGGILTDTFGVRSLFYLVAAFCFVSGIIVVLYVQEQGTERDTKQETPSVRDNLRFAWHHPLMRSVLFSIIVVQAGINFTPSIMAYYLESKGAPSGMLATITGIVVGIVGVLTVVFAPRWGRLSDKHGFAWTLVRMLPWIAIVTMLQAFIPSYEWIFPLRVAIGIFSGAVIPTLFAALSKNAPQERNGGMIGLASSATLVGGLIAPIVCGWVASQIGMMWCFVISGLLFASVLPAAIQMNTASQKKH